MLFGIPTYREARTDTGEVRVTVTDALGVSSMTSFELNVANLSAYERNLNLPDPIGLAEYKYQGEGVDVMGQGNSVAFGSVGGQTLNAAPNSSLQFLVGLGGGDDYQITQNNTVAVIADFGSDGSDRIYAPGIDLESDYTAIISVDNKHLVIGNTLTNQEFWVPNWKDDQFKIETYNLAGNVYTHTFLANTVASLPNYLGNVSFSDLQALTGSEVYNKSLLENTLEFYQNYISNVAPEISTKNSYNSKTGYLVEGTFSISDEATETVDLAIISKPDWLNVDLQGLTFSGVPSRNDIGENNLILKVEDEFGIQSYTTILISVESANSAVVGRPTLKFNKSQFTIELDRDDLIDFDGILKQKSYWEIGREGGSKISIEDTDELTVSPVSFSVSDPIADVFVFGSEKLLQGAQLRVDSHVEDFDALTKTNAFGQFSLSTVPEGPVTISLEPDEIEISSRVEIEDNLGNKETKFTDNFILNALEETVNLSDVLSSLKHIIGLREVSGANFTKGDLNSDGEINLSDVLGMLKHIIGLRELPSPKIVNEDYFISKHLELTTSTDQTNRVEIEINTNLSALAEHYTSDLLGYSIQFASERDPSLDVSLQSINDPSLLAVSNSNAMSIAPNLEQLSALNTIGKFDIGTVKIGQDAYGIADLQVDMELVLKGTNEIITESFQYYFDNGEFLDGAVDLTKGNQRLVIYAPGDMDGTLDNYQGYELG